MARYRDQLDRSCDDFDRAINALVDQLSHRVCSLVVFHADQEDTRAVWPVLASISRVREFVDRHEEIDCSRILAALEHEITQRWRDRERFSRLAFSSLPSKGNHGRTSGPTLPGLEAGLARTVNPAHIATAPKAPWERASKG